MVIVNAHVVESTQHILNLWESTNHQGDTCYKTLSNINMDPGLILPEPVAQGDTEEDKGA